MKIEELKRICKEQFRDEFCTRPQADMAKITLAALEYAEKMQPDENVESGECKGFCGHGECWTCTKVAMLIDYPHRHCDCGNSKCAACNFYTTLVNLVENNTRKNPVLDAVREVLEGE
jgi:hypothetical protein